MSREKTFKVAILWRGDAEARQSATPQNNRFYRIFEELAAVGIHAEPAVYDEAFADEVREQLLNADGVLVWVDPIQRGKTRSELDALLRDVATRGPWVSAHPDVILTIGVKDKASWLGQQYPPLSHHRRVRRRVPFPAAIVRPAGYQAEPG